MARVIIPGFRKIEVSGGGEGTTNYNDLTNKPSINNVPLVKNLNTVDLKLTDATLTEEGVPAEAKTVGAKLEEHSTSLLALKEQLGNHTVESDVPENAVFTDTVYDDTELQKRISNNGYGEVAGGKNLVNPKNIQKGKVVMYTDGTIVNHKDYFISGFISVSSGKTYTKSGFSRNGEHFYYDSAKNPIEGIMTETFTAPDNAAYVILSGIMSDGFNCQLEEGSVATEYEPYFPSNKMLEEENTRQSTEMMDIKMLGWSVPRECPIQNEINGNQFIQKVGRVDLGSLNWRYDATTGHERFRTVDNDTPYIKPVQANNALAKAYSNIYVVNSANGTYSHTNDKSIAIDASSIILVYDTSYTDATTFKTAMQGQYLYYELANYNTITIDGNEEVSSLLKRIEALESLVNKTDTTVNE